MGKFVTTKQKLPPLKIKFLSLTQTMACFDNVVVVVVVTADDAAREDGEKRLKRSSTSTCGWRPPCTEALLVANANAKDGTEMKKREIMKNLDIIRRLNNHANNHIKQLICYLLYISYIT